MSTDDLTANSVIAINASRKQVWDALLSPSSLRHYMSGVDVESQWQEGSNIDWKGEYDEKRYEDHGVILKIEPEKILKFSHFSTLSGKPDELGNYQVVTIMLADGADRTEVSFTLENSEDEQMQLESQKIWTAILERLKKCVEES